IEAAAALNSEILGHGDLDVLDIVPIPERFHEAIREPEHQHVVYWFLSEIVIDAKNRRFVKNLVEYLIEISRRGEIASEGFFDDDARAFGAAGFGKLLDRWSKEVRRNSQVNHRVTHIFQLVVDSATGRKIGIVHGDVPQ